MQGEIRNLLVKLEHSKEIAIEDERDLIVVWWLKKGYTTKIKNTENN